MIGTVQTCSREIIDKIIQTAQGVFLYGATFPHQGVVKLLDRLAMRYGNIKMKQENW